MYKIGEDSFWKWVLSFLYVDLRDPAQVVKFDGNPVYLLNYLLYPQIRS